MALCTNCSASGMCDAHKKQADEAYTRAAQLGAFCAQIDGTPVGRVECSCGLGAGEPYPKCRRCGGSGWVFGGERASATQKIGRTKREPAGSFTDAVAAAERRAVDARKYADRLFDHAIGLRERGTGKPSGGEVKRRPHVHRPVYFGTPAEHNTKLVQGAIRCLTQWMERNPVYRDETYYVRQALEALQTCAAFDASEG